MSFFSEIVFDPGFLMWASLFTLILHLSIVWYSGLLLGQLKIRFMDGGLSCMAWMFLYWGCIVCFFLRSLFYVKSFIQRDSIPFAVHEDRILLPYWETLLVLAGVMSLYQLLKNRK